LAARPERLASDTVSSITAFLISKKRDQTSQAAFRALGFDFAGVLVFVAIKFKRRSQNL